MLENRTPGFRIAQLGMALSIGLGLFSIFLEGRWSIVLLGFAAALFLPSATYLAKCISGREWVDQSHVEPSRKPTIVTYVAFIIYGSTNFWMFISPNRAASGNLWLHRFAGA